MYQKILEEIKQEYYTQNFSNDGQRFVAWYLRNIHLRDRNQTKEDITDGADDKQIDAIFIDEDHSQIIIIQGKFIGAKNVDAEPLREVLSSWVQLKDLNNLQKNANDKLKRKLSEVAKALDDDYEITFELITTASLTDSAQKDLATFQNELAKSEDENFSASILLVDNDELQRRYDIALEKDNPVINHTIKLEPDRYHKFKIAETDVIIAAIPLKECISIKGIKDGTLFQKNVRQSLGLNTVNKGIKSTIYSDKNQDFFFFHNGITAICNKMSLENDSLTLKGLNVVNGCQSLNTILSCSEQVKKLNNAYVLFRFYEIPQRDRADKISISTNSQSAVKPRDLRSNDKRVLHLKKIYEQKYPLGYFKLKRGEIAPADKDKNFEIDVSDLGKYLISWHSKRPNIAYSETRIFDKYFEQLFKRDYRPENVLALSLWMKEIWNVWTEKNPIQLNETLLAMKAYAPYHHLYAISTCFAIKSNLIEKVPSPFACYEVAKKQNMIQEIVKISGLSLNMALAAAANETQPQNKVFSPQNWIKTKTCLSGINSGINMYFNMLPMMEGGSAMNSKLTETLKLPTEEFEYRWSAD
jgi:hypothetical protein